MIGAVIVLYNPDLKLLKSNIDNIKKQVKILILCDNSDDKKLKQEIKKICEKNFIYIDNKGNKGIAYAINRAIEYSKNNNIKWLLTLDQDSLCPLDLIKIYKKYISFPNVGIVCCAVNYNNNIIDIGKEKYQFVQEHISSASLVNVDICAKLGGYDENMFIDLVDFEYCYRLRENDYKVLLTNEVVLNHNLGELKIVHIPFKSIYIPNHNKFRKYYISRNTIYCCKKNKKHISILKCVCKLIILKIKILLFEKDKIVKLKAVFRGIRDGIKIHPVKDNWIR